MESKGWHPCTPGTWELGGQGTNLPHRLGAGCVLGGRTDVKGGPAACWEVLQVGASAALRGTCVWS